MLKFIIAQNLFLFMTPSAAVNLVNAVDVVRHHATSSLPSKNPQGHLSSPLRSDENLRDKFSRHSSNPRDHRTRRSLCLQVRRHVHSNESTPIFLHPDVVANGNASVKQKIRHIPWNTSMKMLCNEAQNIGSGKTTRGTLCYIRIVLFIRDRQPF